MPSALDKAIAKLAKTIDGRYCYGLPHYQISVKLKVKLAKTDLFEENEVSREDNEGWQPFAELVGEPQFLAIQTAAPYGVGMWEHEDGKIHEVWPSFAEFVQRLVDKKDKTPFEKLEKNLEKAGKLITADKYEEALALMEPVMASMPVAPGKRQRFEDRSLSRAQNLYGLALKGVKRFVEARAAFEAAAAAGEDYAVLNMLGMLTDQAQPRDVIAMALDAREHHYFNDYGRAWLARYLAFAYLGTNEPAKAEAELRGVLERFAITDAAKITEIREGLEEYIAETKPGAATATKFLAWFAPKTYEVSPAEAKKSRAWWDSLPEGMRAKLLEEISKEGEPSDEDIARCRDVEECDLDEDVGTFTDLGAFLELPRLTRLSFYGDPDSIEPLRKLSKLERLTINNDVIKDFAWPSRADRDLLKAAEAGDAKGIEKALKAGASITARGEHGSSVLSLLGSDNAALAISLVKRGADPWATDHHDSSPPIESFDRKKIEAAAKAAKIPHPDEGPWRVLKVMRTQGGAHFDRPEGELHLDFDDGVSIKNKWPATVTYAMQAPKKESKLADMMRAHYSCALVSEALAAVLREDTNAELLPVTIVDHAKKKRPEKYFFLNPLLVDCLDVANCYPDWNHIDPESISEASAWPIDAKKAGKAKLFRLDKLNSHPMIISRELGDKLAGFTGVGLGHPRR
jgi:hypothetical protein